LYSLKTIVKASVNYYIVKEISSKFPQLKENVLESKSDKDIFKEALLEEVKNDPILGNIFKSDDNDISEQKISYGNSNTLYKVTFTANDLNELFRRYAVGKTIPMNIMLKRGEFNIEGDRINIFIDTYHNYSLNSIVSLKNGGRGIKLNNLNLTGPSYYYSYLDNLIISSVETYPEMLITKYAQSFAYAEINNGGIHLYFDKSVPHWASSNIAESPVDTGNTNNKGWVVLDYTESNDPDNYIDDWNNLRDQAEGRSTVKYEWNNFTPLNYWYGKDSGEVYARTYYCKPGASCYMGDITILNNADYDTFSAVYDKFAKDKNSIYYLSRSYNYDPDTFHVLSKNIVLDKNGVYYMDTAQHRGSSHDHSGLIEGLSSNGLKVINDKLVENNMGKYTIDNYALQKYRATKQY